MGFRGIDWVCNRLRSEQKDRVHGILEGNMSGDLDVEGANRELEEIDVAE